MIYLTFKDVKRETFEESYAEIIYEIAHEFSRHGSILDLSKIHDYKEQFEMLMHWKADRTLYGKSIRFLSECLEQYYGKKAIVIIDEYDVPLENAFSRNYYDKMSDFIQMLFESGLKDNPSLAFAVVTGCLRVSKESIFTGLNNLEIISVMSHDYDKYFGLTDAEVRKMCADFNFSDKYELIKNWYDGYVFGKENIYNPWSIIRYIKALRGNPDELPKAYWVNTSSNNIVRTLIDHADDAIKEKIEKLIAGGTIETQIHEDITYNEIYENMDNVWNFMFFTGYFRKVREWMADDKICAELTIPNREVRYIFSEKVRNWFDGKVKACDMTQLYTAFVNKDCAALKKELDDIFGETISYMDQNEYYYHGMVAGMLTGIKGFSIRSNRESGKGRSDLFVKPIRKSREAFIIEFKVAKRISEMEAKAEEALQQIADMRYDKELWNEGYDHISCYGIAFCGKECMVKNCVVDDALQ